MPSAATIRRRLADLSRRELGGSPETSRPALSGPSDELRVCGRLQDSPTVRRMPSGRPSASFNILLQGRPSGSPQAALRHAERVAVLACGELGETCGESLRRGEYVCIEGQLRTRNWEDAQGRPASRTELIARSVGMIGNGRVR